MFDLLPNLLTTVATVLFPAFASYKALRSSDPAQLTPWLMYWIVYGILDLVECTFAFILMWVPFYAYMRLMLHVYLVLPGQGGATAIYQTHIHPFFVQYEAEIDDFISNAHERLRSVGLEYLQKAIEYVKVNFLGFAPSPPPPPPQGRQGSYAQNLFSRFNLPAARDGYSAPASDLYGFIAQALGGATTGYGARDGAADELSASGRLIPSNLRGKDERMSYVSEQRDRLKVLLQAFDKEAYNLVTDNTPEDIRRRPVGGGGSSDRLAKSRSELDFDRIERDEVERDRLGRSGGPGAPPPNARRTSSGWMPWNWGGAATPDHRGPSPTPSGGSNHGAGGPHPVNPPYPLTPDEGINRGRSSGYEYR